MTPAVDEPTFYEVLGVRRGCTREEAKEAFHRIARVHHPDKKDPNGDIELFKRANKAYSVLSDLEKRLRYDLKLDGRDLLHQRAPATRTAPCQSRTAPTQPRAARTASTQTRMRPPAPSERSSFKKDSEKVPNASENPAGTSGAHGNFARKAGIFSQFLDANEAARHACRTPELETRHKVYDFSLSPNEHIRRRPRETHFSKATNGASGSARGGTSSTSSASGANGANGSSGGNGGNGAYGASAKALDSDGTVANKGANEGTNGVNEAGSATGSKGANVANESRRSAKRPNSEGSPTKRQKVFDMDSMKNVPPFTEKHGSTLNFNNFQNSMPPPPPRAPSMKAPHANSMHVNTNNLFVNTEASTSDLAYQLNVLDQFNQYMVSPLERLLELHKLRMTVSQVLPPNEAIQQIPMTLDSLVETQAVLGEMFAQTSACIQLMKGNTRFGS